MKATILLLTSTIIFWAGCGGSGPTGGNTNNEPPGTFTVTGVDTTGLDPVVTWTAAEDPDGDPVTYSVFLEDELQQSGISGTAVVLQNLEFETAFTGRVEANDGNGGSSQADFSFTSRAIRIQWEVNLGGSSFEQINSIAQTSDGGFVVAGRSNSSDGDVSGSNGGNDYWVVRLDGQGSLLWENSLGGSNFDVAQSIAQTNDGSFIVAGTTNSSNGDVSGNNGNSDYWVVRLDGQGSILWETNLGGSGADQANSIAQTTDGGFIVGGGSQSSDGDGSGNNGSFDYWVVRLDGQGSLLWETNLGGSGNDQANSIAQTSDGGFIVGGVSSSTNGDVSGNHGGSTDYWVVRLDGQGSLLWENSFGGSGSDLAFSITQTDDGGFIVGGVSSSTNGDVSGNNGATDYWVVKLNSQGSILWETNLGGSGTDVAFSIGQTANGGFIVGGVSGSTDGDVSGNNGNFDYWVVKLDGQGSILWETSLGGSGSDQALSIGQTTDGGFIVGGFSQSSDGDVSGNNGSGDYWIVKLR